MGDLMEKQVYRLPYQNRDNFGNQDRRLREKEIRQKIQEREGIISRAGSQESREELHQEHQQTSQQWALQTDKENREGENSQKLEIARKDTKEAIVTGVETLFRKIEERRVICYELSET